MNSVANQHGAVTKQETPAFTVERGPGCASHKLESSLAASRVATIGKENAMRAIQSASVHLNASLISAILNLVCPDCGGSMMGFRCQGKCLKDWRAEWDAHSKRVRNPMSRAGKRL
jgi:hypothetical protein